METECAGMQEQGAGGLGGLPWLLSTPLGSKERVDAFQAEEGTLGRIGTSRKGGICAPKMWSKHHEFG